jgi:hypothetical protein
MSSDLVLDQLEGYRTANYALANRSVLPRLHPE